MTRKDPTSAVWGGPDMAWKALSILICEVDSLALLPSPVQLAHTGH